jgi:hypothetical protein
LDVNSHGPKNVGCAAPLCGDAANNSVSRT